MESVVRWKKGEPDEAGFYLVTTSNGIVAHERYRKYEDGKTYVVRKKKQYPKTLMECYKELDIAVRKMRDAIKEQFDKDLETCKEFL